MTDFEGLVVVTLMVLSIGLVGVGVLLVRIEKILQARGLKSPHVIVSTGENGVMKNMNLDISGPGYSNEPMIRTDGTFCEITSCRFVNNGRIATKKPDADPMQEGYVRKGGTNPPCPVDAVRPPPPGAQEKTNG